VATINLDHLRYFFDAARETSLAKAARRNFVSISAVSQAIRKLEATLEVDLLIHQRNRFKLTDEGRFALSQCQTVFSALDDLRNQLKATKTSFTGTVAFATSHSIAQSLLPRCLGGFRSKYPGVKPRFRLGTTPLIRGWVESGEAEFGLTLDDGQLGTLETLTLREGSFRGIKLKKARGEPSGFLLTESRPETEQLRLAYRKKHKLELPVAMEIDSWEIIRSMALQGLGIGFIPDFLSQDPDVRRQIVFSHDVPDVRYRLCAIYKREGMLSRNARTFLETFKTTLRPRE
jgi:LysR family transcriptional regulator, carnitine catabolism transcriptional activator